MMVLRVLICICLILVMARPSHALTIREGLRIVLQRATEVKISEAERDVALEEVGVSESLRLPRLQLYAEQTWLRYPPETSVGQIGTISIGEAEYLSLEMKFTELLYDFGKTPSLIRSSRLKLEMRQEEVKAKRNEIGLRFTEAFLDALEAEEMVHLASKEVERYRAHLKDTEALYREGLVTRNDLLQAEVLLADARQRMVEAENNLHIAYSYINHLLQRSLEEEITLERPCEWPSYPWTLEESYQRAVMQRPELRALRTAVESVESLIDSLKAEYLPGFYLSGGFAYQENRYMLHEQNWSVMVSMKLDLLTGGMREARLKQRKAEMRKLQLQRRLLADRIRLQVKDSYLSLETAKKKLQVARKALEQAEENLRLQRLRYKEGVGTATEVTDAVAMLSRAETNYWHSLYEKMKAEARLYYNTGTDLLTLLEETDEGQCE